MKAEEVTALWILLGLIDRPIRIALFLQNKGEEEDELSVRRAEDGSGPSTVINKLVVDVREEAQRSMKRQ